jgi:hypothetical protein
MSSKKLPATGRTAIIEVTPRKKPRGRNAYTTRTAQLSAFKKSSAAAKKAKLHHHKQDDNDTGHFHEFEDLSDANVTFHPSDFVMQMPNHNVSCSLYLLGRSTKRTTSQTPNSYMKEWLPRRNEYISETIG